MVAPVNLMRAFEFSKVTVPPHWEANGASATVTPEGRLSINPTPVNATILVAGLPMVNDNVEFVPTGILDGENDLLIVGGINR
jgi:hypothetical protein